MDRLQKWDAAVAVSGAGIGPGLGGATEAPSRDPNIAACMAQGRVNCNPDPGVYATFVAKNPIAQPPSANPHYVSEADVLVRARGRNVAAPAAARMVNYGELARIDAGLGSSGVVHPDRKVWVVTVRGDIETPGSLREPPRTVHVYSLVIDGETGTVTDMCYGCAAVATK